MKLKFLINPKMTITSEEKKRLSEALKEAMIKEELHTSQAAKYLNLAPYYISMAQNEKSFAAMGVAPWIRIKEWMETRMKISEFTIPEGEPIWTVSGKPEKKEEKEVPADDKQSTPSGKKPKKEVKKKWRSVKIEAEVKQKSPTPEMDFTLESADHKKFIFDIEINLVINGQRIQL